MLLEGLRDQETFPFFSRKASIAKNLYYCGQGLSGGK